MRKLLEVPALKSLRETAQKQNIEKSKTLAPVGLKWEANSCWFDSALQQLVNEPTIAEELALSASYKNGDQNPLYLAVKGYRDCQARGETTFDAASILWKHFGGRGESRDALGDGWQAFEDLFDFDHIQEKSHLRSLFKNPVRIQIGKGSDPDLSTLAAEKLDPEDPPAVFSLQVQDRLTAAEEVEQPLPSDKVSEEECLAFLTDVTNAIAEQPQLTDEEMAQLQIQLPSDELTLDYLTMLLSQCGTPENKKKLCARIAFDAIKAVFVAKDGNDNNPLERLTNALLDDESDDSDAISEIAAEFLDNKANQQAAFELLTADQKKAINAHRTPRLEYNDNPVKIADTGQLSINGKPYDIASFTCYIPEREHFIT